MTNTARQLVEAHIPFADFLINRGVTAPPHIAKKISSACLEALVRTADNYTPDSGVKFRTYHEPHIRGAIADALRGESPAMPSFPRNSRRTVAKLTSQLGRTLSKEEVVEFLDIPLCRDMPLDEDHNQIVHATNPLDRRRDSPLRRTPWSPSSRYSPTSPPLHQGALLRPVHHRNCQ